MFRFQRGELLWIAVFSACIIVQLFVHPSIGLANNGDFSKMIGRFSLGPPSHDSSEEYVYFTARWVYDRSFYWMSEDVSSELIPISAAVLAGWWFSSEIFDIRILGAIHALLWIGCFAALMPLLRPIRGWRRRNLIAAAALFIFTDVSYVAHLNSFYTDVAGFVFLAWAVVLWLHLVEAKITRLYGFFIVACVLCVSSKSQHAPLGVFLVALAIPAAASFDSWRKYAALASLLLVVAAAVVTFRMMPALEREANVYHVIFMSILRKSPAPVSDLRELGLGEEYLRYVGHWPQSVADDPIFNSGFHNDFTSRTNFGKIALFHLRHPWRTLAIIYRELHTNAQKRRFFGNYQRSRGKQPGVQTRLFGWWSALRSALFHFAPWHIVVWYAFVIGMGLRVALRPTSGEFSRLGWFALSLAGMGLVELAISSLTDTGETERHLFLFHVITDFTMLLGVVWAAWRFQGSASLRTKS